MHLTHKIRIFPSKEQEVGLLKACGVARFTYNWGLNQCQESYKAGKRLSAIDLHKNLCRLKTTEFPWMYESTKCAPQRALVNLEKAYKMFFAGLKTGKKVGKPKHKKKGKSKDSFYIDNTHLQIKDKEFKVPKIKGTMRMAEPLRFTGKIISYTVSRDVDRWYVSVTVDTSGPQELPKTGQSTGVDLGIKTMATLANSETIENPKYLKLQQKKLARQQRILARRQKGSKNREKQRIVVAKSHRKVRLSRLNHTHQVTTKLVREYDTIVVEDLKVANMVKNRKLSRAISDVGFGMFRAILAMKCARYGKQLIVAPTFYPSSKTCSQCGHVKEILLLSERVFKCGNCNSEIDRDLNAAINLMNLVACCHDVKPVDSVLDKLLNKQLAVEDEAGRFC